MLGRRLLVVVAVLLGLAAVTTSLAPPRATRSPDDTAAQLAPGRSAPELEPRGPGGRSNVASERDVRSEPSVMELDAQDTRQRVAVRAGQRVRLEIRSTGLESAQIGVDGPVEAIDPDSPARFDLLYEAPARLAIRVSDPAGEAARTIGRLDVLAAR